MTSATVAVPVGLAGLGFMALFGMEVSDIFNDLDKQYEAAATKLQEATSLNSKRGSSNISFLSGQAKRFYAQTIFKVEDQSYVENISEMKQLTASVEEKNVLPSTFIGKINDRLSTEKVENSNPSNCVISDISDGNITGKSNAAGDKLELTFTYKGTSIETVPFTFILTDKVNKVSTTVSATVKLQVKPCSAAQNDGDNTPEAISYNMGKTSGTFDFSYNTMTIKDQIIKQSTIINYNISA